MATKGLCSICLEDCEDQEPQLSCHHRFHRACLQTWYHHSNSQRCPYCRQEIRDWFQEQGISTSPALSDAGPAFWLQSTAEYISSFPPRQSLFTVDYRRSTPDYLDGPHHEVLRRRLQIISFRGSLPPLDLPAHNMNIEMDFSGHSNRQVRGKLTRREKYLRWGPQR